MANKVYKNGVVHDTIPSIYKNNWHRSVPWVFSNGAWHRAYDLGDENLLANSRMLNGTDIFCYSDGVVIGNVPPCYTVYNNSTNTGNNAFAISFNQDNENTKGYTFRTIDSRMFFQTRISLKAGKTYTASVMVKNNDLTLVHSGVLADIYMDNGEPIDNYLTFKTKFDNNPLIGEERTRIYSTFTAKKDCLIQFNFGVGVRYNTNGDFSFDSPMVTNTNILIDYQPTPHVLTNEAIILNGDAGFSTTGSLMVANKTHKVSGGLVIGDIATELVIASKNVGDISTGMGINLETNTFWVKTPDGVYHTKPLKRPLPRNNSIGVAVWFDVSNGFAQNIRLYVNGEVYARITDPYLSLDTGLNTVFGLNSNNITIEQFEIYMDGNSHLFNISNQGNGKLVSTDGKLVLDIVGDTIWWSTVAPKITKQPQVIYNAQVGDTVVIESDCDRFSTVQWKTSRGVEVGNSKNLEIEVTPTLDTSIFYYAIYKNSYGQVTTRSTRIQIS
ncbi:hypothetical protein F485_gp018 [Aeromonas phage CC2]|uniref:Uncharacterized protein n=1 Tax=Aeromonas phage CC2 TaxID=1204516 RepID=I6XLN7_9CAUD|nr:hypothetical protein F485_gp018 [Aeromonas phage CC2]AFN39424.1 hypothetical protein CC2_323 [Aeromonas phage CC2]